MMKHECTLSLLNNSVTWKEVDLLGHEYQRKHDQLGTSDCVKMCRVHKNRINAFVTRHSNGIQCKKCDILAVLYVLWPIIKNNISKCKAKVN
jgi:hypothetical protein